MRKYAYLKEPLKRDDMACTYKIMLCGAEEGVYLFEYSAPDALLGSSDLCYASLADLYAEWDDLIDEKGWIDIEDPLPDCQQDAFIPIRVKGRNIGRPEWGKLETLRDGKWVDYP